jgi:hypothetical protein
VKEYYQESNILIIAYSSVVTVAEWLDGSFESQSSGSRHESPKISKRLKFIYSRTKE